MDLALSLETDTTLALSSFHSRKQSAMTSAMSADASEGSARMDKVAERYFQPDTQRAVTEMNDVTAPDVQESMAKLIQRTPSSLTARRSLVCDTRDGITTLENECRSGIAYLGSSRAMKARKPASLTIEYG
jgi:hypothetical protein